MGRLARPEKLAALAVAGAIALSAVAMGLRWWQIEDAAARRGRELVVPGECRPWAGWCEARSGALRLRLRFEGPHEPLRRFAVRVAAEGGTEPAEVTIRFEMPGMAMGQVPLALTPDGAGGWRGEAVLPVCATGRTDWVAEVRAVPADGRDPRLARFPFTVGGER